MHSPSRPVRDHGEGRGSHAIRNLIRGGAPEGSAAPTEPPSPRSILDASLEQARVVALDDYKLRWTGSDVTVVANLPGVKPSEVSFVVDPGLITISSMIRPDTDKSGGALWQLCREMRPVRSDQRLPIPRGLLVDRWTATFEDGVLRLRIPRARRP